MPLIWGPHTEPTFDPLATPVSVAATKSMGGGESAWMTFTVHVGVEGPTPAEDTVLGWLSVIYDALAADGWTADLRMEQTATSWRQAQEA